MNSISQLLAYSESHNKISCYHSFDQKGNNCFHSFVFDLHCAIGLEACAVLQHLFPSSCFRLSPKSCYDDGRVRTLLQKNFWMFQKWYKGFKFELCDDKSVCVKRSSNAPLTTLAKFKPKESWHCHLELLLPH